MAQVEGKDEPKNLHSLDPFKELIAEMKGYKMLGGNLMNSKKPIKKNLFVAFAHSIFRRRWRGPDPEAKDPEPPRFKKFAKRFLR